MQEPINKGVFSQMHNSKYLAVITLLSHTLANSIFLIACRPLLSSSKIKSHQNYLDGLLSSLKKTRRYCFASRLTNSLVCRD